jgi:AcrR family transcriptional regulator
MADKSTRPYSSPLRENQVRQTQDLILDALTELLLDRRPDEITTREIAEAAGVSQPTVYRHFPDRDALLAGLTARIGETGSQDRLDRMLTIDDFAPMIMAMFESAEEHEVEFTAEALLNSDPRRFSDDTRHHSDVLRTAVESAFPDLGEGACVELAALLRCVGSVQSWLRMREEFGVPGHRSGPLVRWAIDVLIAEARRGNLP